MSSTERDDEARAAAIFDALVVPLAKSRASAAPAAAESFYADVPPMTKADFELRVGSSGAQVRALLAAEWRHSPELQPLAEALAAFADSLPPTPDDEAAAELSPFIYVMF